MHMRRSDSLLLDLENSYMAKLATQLSRLGWESVSSLGGGGQGDVFLVQRINDTEGKQFALKILNNRGGNKANLRFRQELDIIKKIDHKGIVKVIEAAEPDSDFQYYVMNYVNNAKSLKRRMEEKTNPFFQNPLKAVDGFIEIVHALSACEELRVVHRDLSPANVLVTEDGGIVLIDFGLCHNENGNMITLTDEPVGTPNYRPPECSGYS